MTRSRNPALNDKRSGARIDNLRRLVVELQQRAMRITDICKFLGVERSTARGYVNGLADVLDVTCGALFKDAHVYRLIDDPERVAACLTSLCNAPLRPLKARSQIAVAERAGRHFHFLADDEAWHVKVSRVRIPQHFPLLAAFFGLAQPEQRV